MFKKNNIGIVFVALLAIIFSYTYSTAISKYTTSKQSVENASSLDVQNPNENYTISTKIKENTKIIFRTIDKKSKKVIKEEVKKADELLGKTKEDLEEAYKDYRYVVVKMTEDEVILQKYSFNPNKYILGIDNGYVVIIKTDEDGVESIEKTTDKKVNMLHEEDIKLLENGELEYDTMEEALENLADYE